MNSRREFFKTVLGFVLKSGLLAGGLLGRAGHAAADGVRRLLPRGSDPRQLFNDDPRDLDTRNLEPMPVEQFDTMGDTDVEIDLAAWHLEVTGNVARPLKLTLEDLLARSFLERKVLLICPGFFSLYGTWKGISLGKLLQDAGAATGASRITVDGFGGWGKREKFPIRDVISDGVFLAYAVNGRPLPRKHGFPLRVVAEDHWGEKWVKYVYRVTVG